jgi:transposase
MKVDLEALRAKFKALAPIMDERVSRLWAAAEVESLGRGGTAALQRATGISGRRIWKGKKELAELRRQPPSKASTSRVRRPGGGRRRLSVKDAKLLGDLQERIEPVTRGEPQSPLQWTTKSVRHLASELRERGHEVSSDTVARMLHEAGYSLQAPRKEDEGASHPDRDAQFRYIARQAKAFQRGRQPVVSVDAKKKELIGNFKTSGREWHPQGQAPRVNAYDFPDMAEGKAIPYGVYDLARDEGWVNVGTDHDTPEFAVQSLRRWWLTMGKHAYPHARELLVVADAGGSNSARSRVWKKCLQEFADATGLKVSVSHYPPGTSKWNKIEHRLFAQITLNWRGRPLTSYQVVINLIGSTTTRTGLHVRTALDTSEYPLGVRVSDTDFGQLNIRKKRFHGEWNYSLSPRRQASARLVK